MIFAVEGRADLVAKIYSKTPDERKTRKLKEMVVHAAPQLLEIAAWPVDLVANPTGTVQGFVMPRVADRRDIHQLYSPKSRAEAFPNTNFRFLVHAAGNVARSFAVVHAQGHILGDVNHSNVLVGPDGTVMLIDCDSFQIRADSTVFTCDVGVSLFTPPELQGRSLRGCVRTPNHDRFGLAVLIFQLLYMGRHPFAGRYSGPGEMSIEKAIAENRFVYGPDRSRYGMLRPPGAAPLEAMGPAIAANFLSAFSPQRVGRERPAAAAWLEAIIALEKDLRECSAASWHHYPHHVRSCPWCAMESATGIRLFGLAIKSTSPIDTGDAAAIFLAITSVQGPGPDPALPSSRRWVPPPGVKLPNDTRRRIRKASTYGLVAIGLLLMIFFSPLGLIGSLAAVVAACVVWPRVSREKRAQAGRQYAQSKDAWQKALQRWENEASEARFKRERDQLERVHRELSMLADEHGRRRAALERDRESQQLQRYLDRIRIGSARIRGIGPARVAMLEAYGIETAADLSYNKVIVIDGFGEGLTRELMEWQRAVKRKFRFDPSKPVDPRDLDALNREVQARNQGLLKELRQGPEALRRTSREVAAARTRLMPALEGAWTTLQIAERWKSGG